MNNTNSSTLIDNWKQELRLYTSKVKEFLRLKNRTLIGVFLSEFSVSAVLLEQINNEIQLIDYFIHENTDSFDYFEGLEKLYAKFKNKTKYVAISVSGPKTFSKIIHISAELSEQEIIDTLELEGEKYLSSNLDNFYIDVEILEKLIPGSNNMQKVLVIGANIEMVDESIELIEQYGFKVEVVECANITRNRLYNNLISPNLDNKGSDTVSILVELYRRKSLFIVYEDKYEQVFKELNFGTDSLLKDIQKRYLIDSDIAKNLLRTINLPDDCMYEILEPYKQKLVLTLKKEIQVYSSNKPGSKINYVILAGDVRLIPGIIESLSELLGLKVIAANPFLRVKLNSELSKKQLFIDAPSLLACSGLSLRNIEHA